MNPVRATAVMPWRTFAAVGLVSAGFAAGAAGLAAAHAGPFASPQPAVPFTRLVSSAPSSSPLRAEDLFRPTSPPPAPDLPVAAPAEQGAPPPADAAATSLSPGRAENGPAQGRPDSSPSHPPPTKTAGAHETEPSPQPSPEPTDRPEPAQSPEPVPSPEISH